MKFDRLVLHNFGAYKGEHTFDLSRTSRSKPIILVGGLNGAGKSTLMDAIQLALFGKLAKCGGRRGLGYDEYLRRSVHHDVLPQQARVQLSVRYQSGGQSHAYTIDRSWTCAERTVREHVDVTHNGVLDRTLSDGWLEHVEQWLPSDLSQLFFFDGEQLEALADAKTSASVLRSAVEALLGLDLVARLSADLDLLERRKRGVTLPPQLQRELALLEEEIAALETRRAELTTDEAEARVALERRAKDLAEVSAKFAREGGELFERRGLLEAQHAAIVESLERIDRELREIAAGAAPLLVVRTLLGAAEAQADREAVGLAAGSVQRILQERDSAVVARLRKSAIPEAVIETVSGLLDEDRLTRERDSSTPPYLELSDPGRSTLGALNREVLDQTGHRINSLTGEWAALEAAREGYERQLASIPTAEALAGLLAERNHARSALSVAESALAAASADLTRVRAQLVKLQGNASRRHLRVHEARGGFADAQRSLKHIALVKSTLKRFRQALLDRHVGRLEDLSFDSLRQLLRKERLVSAIHIDRGSFAVTLDGPVGTEIVAERLSAGERQLLATALLWGLRRAAGRAVPLVIDTPLGRLDSSHREHLVTRYFPNASHQVILLSTDEEISGRYYESLRPYVAAEFTLESDDAAQSVRIRPGYFSETSEVICAP